MNRKQAIDKYLKHNTKMSKIVDCLERWDSKLTVKDNAILIGISKENAFRIADRYKLDFVFERWAYKVKRKMKEKK